MSPNPYFKKISTIWCLLFSVWVFPVKQRCFTWTALKVTWLYYCTIYLGAPPYPDSLHIMDSHPWLQKHPFSRALDTGILCALITILSNTSNLHCNDESLATSSCRLPDCAGTIASGIYWIVGQWIHSGSLGITQAGTGILLLKSEVERVLSPALCGPKLSLSSFLPGQTQLPVFLPFPIWCET